MSWPLKPLSELCLLAVDCVNKTAPVVNYPTPYKMIRTTNVKKGFIDVDTVRYVTEETFQSWTRRSQPRFGDVVMTREAPVGEVGRCTFDDDQNIFLGQRLFLYRPDPQLLDWNYLAYVLQSPLVQNKLHGMSFGATVPHIKVGDAENLEIPCPSLDAQKRIGSLLATYDDLIEANRRRIYLLEEAARLLFREWFINLRFPNYQTVKSCEALPRGWSVVTLGDLAFLNYGKALKDSDRRSGEIPVYGSSGIVGFHDQALVGGPGIIVGRKGNVGSVYFSECDFFPIDTVFYVSKEQSSYFVHQLLKTMNFISSDSAVPGLNRNYAHGLPVLKPEEKVLGQFEQLVDPIYRQIETLLKANKNTAEARDALLPKLMSGAIQV